MEKLSIRGKIALVPSLSLTLPLLVLTIATGFVLWIVAFVFRITGLLDACQWQIKYFQGLVRENRLKMKMKSNQRKRKKHVQKG